MGEIIPRWEWRHFAKEIKLDIDLGKYEKTRHVESTEMYIPSTVVDENPKFRDNKMDVKSLQKVDQDGLEQWKPVIKVEFPLPLSEMEKVFEIYRLAMPSFKSDPVPFEEFLAEAKSNSRLLPVEVVKVRDLYDVDGCIVEYATVTIDGKKYVTAAAEDPDTELVKKTVNKLGLWGKDNINYVRAIKDSINGKLK